MNATLDAARAADGVGQSNPQLLRDVFVDLEPEKFHDEDVWAWGMLWCAPCLRPCGFQGFRPTAPEALSIGPERGFRRKGTGRWKHEMKVHLFNLSPTGLLRAWNQCKAGRRLCRAARKPFHPLVPESINSMTAAWNVWRIFQGEKLPVPGTLWDVGANVSQMARMILMLNEDAEVVSFEPNAELKPIGRSLVLGISDTDGEGEFVLRGNDALWGALQEGGTALGGGTPVKVRRLDSMIDGGELSWDRVKGPLFLKVDVEGGELKVLRGMGRYLRDVSYLLVELDNGDGRGNEYDAMDLYGIAREAGFGHSRIVYACYDGPDAPTYCDVFFWKDQPDKS